MSGRDGGCESARTLLPSSPPSPQLAIVAGEASGDLLGSLLIEALAQAGVETDIGGITGPRMQAAGARSWFPMEALSVRGYVEALGGLRRILGIRKALRRRLLARPPRLFVGVDAPDFNLSLEADLKRAGVATVHFVSPSVWAWRPKRIGKVRAAASHVLLIFPFEQALYQQAGIPATYVGHPLAHALPEPRRLASRARLGLAADNEYVALLPGSRPGELKALARLYVDMARVLHARRPETLPRQIQHIRPARDGDDAQHRPDRRHLRGEQHREEHDGQVRAERRERHLAPLPRAVPQRLRQHQRQQHPRRQPAGKPQQDSRHKRGGHYFSPCALSTSGGSGSAGSGRAGFCDWMICHSDLPSRSIRMKAMQWSKCA